jgi:hypothetical protein
MTDVAVLLGAERESATKELWLCIEFEKKLANVSKVIWNRTAMHYKRLSV